MTIRYTAADDLAAGLYQLEQRGAANPPERAVFNYLRTLQHTIADLIHQTAILNSQLDTLRRENVKLSELLHIDRTLLETDLTDNSASAPAADAQLVA